MSDVTPTTSTPRDRRGAFVRIAESRVSRALDSIQRIGPLANPALYEYDPAQASQIVGALKDQLGKLERQFTTRKPAVGFQFQGQA